MTAAWLGVNTVGCQLHGAGWTPGPALRPGRCSEASDFPWFPLVLEEAGGMAERVKGTSTPNGTLKLPSTMNKCS